MMRRLQLPRCSVRHDTSHMAGAIFMSNSETREDCFGTGVFGLPPEYEHFVTSVRQGMPLFLFDYTDRKLYGVFEATSHGGMDIRRSAFTSTGRTYPAQVCFNIVWKCRPLTEDEFFPAIEDNYYNFKKFYFDLSYQQVVNLYGLFDKKRVERPVSNYPTSASLEIEQSMRRRPDKRSLSPNISPRSADQFLTSIPSSSPKISTVETSCSAASTSMHPTVPHSFETQPNVDNYKLQSKYNGGGMRSKPDPGLHGSGLVTKPFGVQTAPIHSNQLQLPYHHSHERLRTIDGTSTQVAAPDSQTLAYHRDPFVANQSYPLYHDYLQSRLSSGCSTQGPSDGVRMSVKQSYEGSSSLYSRYSTQAPTGDDRSYLSSTSYVPSYPHIPPASPQRNAHLEDDYDNCEQCKAMYASEHQHVNRRKSVTPLELTQQGIPAYPEVPEGSAISQHKESFIGYTSGRIEDFEKEQQRRDFNHDGSGSSGSRNDTGAYIPDRPYTNHDVEDEAPTQRQPVFTRLSVKKSQPPSQEIPGPSLNQLLYSLSKRSEQWGSKTRSPTEDARNQFVSEQDIDRSYAPAEFNLPCGLEEEEESADPPFLDFKRRSKATSLDTINAGNEVGDNKAKRRKLVRPSFGQSNYTASSGKEHQENVITESNHSPFETVGNKLQENVMMEENHSSAETIGNRFFIDLNEPASVDSDMVEDDSEPAIAVMTQTEQPREVISKQDHLSDKAAPTEKISLDLNITDQNTLDEAKLQAILDSSLLQALDKLRNGKSNSNDSENANKPTSCAKTTDVKMEMKPDKSANKIPV